MSTKIEKADLNHPSEEVIARAAEIIRGGGLVAFPTETVYGLGADALQPEAARRIYEAKGRPSDNPLIVHIADLEALDKIASVVPEKARALAEAFWPGPLTMIFAKSGAVPYETTGGLDTVAVRMPSHPVAQALIRESGGYIAAPSANTSGRPSPTRAEHVAEDLDGRIPLILDGGEVEIGIESTIVDLSVEPPMILRPGYITREMIGDVIGEVRDDPALTAAEEDARPKAPGMKYRHYAPKAEMILVSGNVRQVTGQIGALAKERRAEGKKVGIICGDETHGCYDSGVVRSIGSRQDEDGIARRLYAVLREFDALGVDVIYSESFSTPRIGRAIMNRLMKAAGRRVIELGEKRDWQKAFDRVIFVGKGATCRAPMAMELLKREELLYPVSVEARGLVVLFPQPLNQKAEAVMANGGIRMKEYMTRQLESEDFAEHTLILTFHPEVREKVLEIEAAQNVYVLTELTGDGQEIADPYGGELVAYGHCFEVMADTIHRFAKLLNDGEFFVQ